MADVKISALPVAATVALTDYIPCVIAADLPNSPKRATFTVLRAALLPAAIASDVSGLGSNVASMLATFSSANIATACTDETGTGSLVFGTAPLFKTTINLNNPGNTFKYVVTPAAIAADRILNLPLLTGTDTVVTAAFIQTLTNKTVDLGSNTVTFTSAQLKTACSDETGSGGALVFATDPTITNTSINNATSGGTINDCTLSGTAGSVRILRFTDAVGPTCTGFDATGVTNGTILRVVCAGGGVGVTHLGAGSAAANRVMLNAGITVGIPAGCYTSFFYDLASAVWREAGAAAI